MDNEVGTRPAGGNTEIENLKDANALYRLRIKTLEDQLEGIRRGALKVVRKKNEDVKKLNLEIGLYRKELGFKV